MNLIKKYWWIILIAILLLRKKVDKVANIDKTVVFGDKNYDVLTMQKRINKNLSSGKIKEDSIFGNNTGFALYVILEHLNLLDENYIRIDDGTNGKIITEVQVDWLYENIK